MCLFIILNKYNYSLIIPNLINMDTFNDLKPSVTTISTQVGIGLFTQEYSSIPRSYHNMGIGLYGIPKCFTPP